MTAFACDRPILKRIALGAILSGLAGGAAE
jgi:hypothetical protein